MVKKKSSKKIIVIVVIIILILTIIYFFFLKKSKIEFGSSNYSRAFITPEKIEKSTDVNVFDIKTNPFEKNEEG